MKLLSERKRGVVAAYWFQKHQSAERQIRELQSQLSADKANVERISNMYRAIDAKFAALRNALAIVASFDADCWSARLKGYERKP
jgi:hypothetical protein